jgi:tetratricopeptide (TPR) repeat protein
MLALAAALLFPAFACSQQIQDPRQSQDQLPEFRALQAQAADARQENKVTLALQLYREALTLNPKWPDGWWYLGQLSYASSQFTAASDDLTRYLQLVPNAGPAFAMRGLCEFELRDFNSSLSDIQRAVALGAGNNSRNRQILLFHEAILLTHASRFEEALASLQILARVSPPDSQLLTAIGLAGLRIPIFPAQALPAQQQPAVAAGQAAWSWFNGHAEDAARGFSALFSQFPTLTDAHYFYAYLLFGHSSQDAIPQLRSELLLDPNNVSALILMAWCQILDGYDYEALPYARLAAQLAPSRFMSQLDLGRALVDSDAVSEGLQHLLEARKLQPDSLEVHLGLAIAYAKSGQPALARSERLTALALSGRNPVYGQQ